MGSSVWEYLWLLAHVTAEDAAGDGKSLGVVEHGNPVPTNRIAADLGRSRDATLTNLESGWQLHRALSRCGSRIQLQGVSPPGMTSGDEHPICDYAW
jgi:hypothetical protein